MKRIEFLVLAVFLSAMVFTFEINVSAQQKKEFLIIADKTASCSISAAASGGNCLQVKRINEEKYTVFNESIENFQFTPGYFYLLEVIVSPIAANPPVATPKFKYELEKILSRVKAGDSSAAVQPEFSGTEWRLTHILGNPIKSEKAFIKFDAERNAVIGNGGCNDFKGNLTKKGNQIKMPEIFPDNKQFCAEASLNENKFLVALDYVTGYEIAGDKLKLLNGDKVVLEFEAKK